MSSSIISDEARSFYNVFKELRTYLTETPNISSEDKQKIGELLRVLKFKIEFDILEESLQSDNYITSVVADIDTKLLHIDEERKRINEGIQDMELVTSNRRLIALRRTSNELESIKTYISERQFSYYIDAMNAKLDSTASLVSACNLVLKHGLYDYTQMFGKTIIDGNGIDKEGIDLLFQVISDKSLKNELVNYLNVERRYRVIQEEKDNNDLFVRLLNLAKKNEVTVREFMKVRAVLSEDAVKANLRDKEELATSRVVLENLSSSGLAGIFNRKQREQLQVDILKLETSIKDYNDKLEEVKKLKSILEGLGLGGVVESLSKINDGEILTVEDKVAAYLKMSVRRNSFEVNSAFAKIKERNQQLDSKLVDESIYLSGAVNSLSNRAHKLVTAYHDDVFKLFSLLNSRKENEFSPLLAAYLLKMLSDSRSLTYEEINEMCCFDIDVDALFKSYALMNQVETRNIQEQMMGIAEEEEKFSEDYQAQIVRKI